MSKANPQVVTAAIIERNGTILIGKRKQGKHNVGTWEFPGGTVEEGETYEECLERELYEELGVKVRIGPFVCQSEHDYRSDWTIRLFVFRVTVLSGEFSLQDYDELRWVEPINLPTFDFSPASAVVARHLADAAATAE